MRRLCDMLQASSPQGVDMCGLWHGSAWFQGICVVWAIIWQKSFWNPHDPKKHGFSWFCRYKGVFRFCCSLLVPVPIQWCQYSAIHDVYPSLSKQAQVTTTIWRLAGLNLNALWSGTLILLTLYVSIDISQWQLLTFLHHCDTRCLLPMFGTAAGAEATNDPCCLSFYLPLLDLFREVYDLGQVFRYGMFIMFILC